MTVTHYTAFYPSRPFWAGDKIDPTDPDTLKHFTAFMSEDVFEDSTDLFEYSCMRGHHNMAVAGG